MFLFNETYNEIDYFYDIMGTPNIDFIIKHIGEEKVIEILENSQQYEDEIVKAVTRETQELILAHELDMIE